MPWLPGMPWPGTAGGADGGSAHPWGPNIRLFVRANIAAGRPWTMGPHQLDRLDAGNVVGPVVNVAPPATGRLWVDLTCETMSVELYDGSTRAVGIFSRDEAATLTVDVHDPNRVFDPLNTDSPYWFRGRTRLVAGVPVEVFAEVVNPATSVITKFQLFTGTADSWLHDVEPTAQLRVTKLTASGAIKAMTHTDYPEAAPVGAGDTTAQRVARIATYFGWSHPVVQVGASSTVTLAATTLAQSFWELLNRTLDDELGYVHVLPDGTIRWLSRNVWTMTGAPVIVLGCLPAVPAAFDIVTDLVMGTVDDQLRNAVYASRTGGVMQIVKAPVSVDRFGGFETALRRTDLGLADDTQVAEWASTVVMLYAFPQPAPERLAMVPGLRDVTGNAWRAVLGINYATDIARVVWQPDDTTAPLDTTVRVVGAKHTISPTQWQVEWQTVPAGLTAGTVWHMGPHALDRLDAGNVIGYRHALALTERQEDAA